MTCPTDTCQSRQLSQLNLTFLQIQHEIIVLQGPVCFASNKANMMFRNFLVTSPNHDILTVKCSDYQLLPGKNAAWMLPMKLVCMSTGGFLSQKAHRAKSNAHISWKLRRSRRLSWQRLAARLQFLLFLIRHLQLCHFFANTDADNSVC